MYRRIAIVGLALLAATGALAQSAGIAFSTGSFDPTAPVEVSADQLSLEQSSGNALFEGNVVVVQGQVRLAAQSLRVEYAKDASGKPAKTIDRIVASGGVTLVTGPEAAEANEAVYTVGSGQILMTGDVVLTQGPNAISGQKLTVDLASGAGRMEGGVRTLLGGGR